MGHVASCRPWHALDRAPWARVHYHAYSKCFDIIFLLFKTSEEIHEY